jgi:hypothetical protein
LVGTKVATESSQMTRKIAPLAALLVLALACGRSGKVQRGQQQYEVVQEGSASGVTSTINAPGETPAPMTNTNADTTTNLTLGNPNPLGNSTAAPVDGSMSSNPIYAQATPFASPAQRVRLHTSAAPIVTDTIGSATPPMPKERRVEPSTDTASATTSDTEATSSSATEPKKKKDNGNNSDSQEPPPPPPPTDTTGTPGR